MEKNVLTGLEPQAVFAFFEQLCAIPHGSGNTAAASAWAVDFARQRGLKHRRDAAGNVVIWKDASPGYEDHPPVMLQGHLDMVCVKDSGISHDFLSDPLELCVEGDWIKARGTTLGGDDGAAVAMALAVLDSGAIAHPPLEVLLTIDEETGMTGANAVDASDLRSRRLINIDSEVEGVFTAGCAGGARSDIRRTFPAAAANGKVCTLTVMGLQGGHSGVDINKGRANANKLLAECLAQLPGIRLISFSGGEQDNAIPVQARAEVLLADSDVEGAQAAAHAWLERAKEEYPQDNQFSLQFTWADRNDPVEALSPEDTGSALKLLLDAPNGIQSMEPDLPGQVRTSLNMGVVRLEKGTLHATFCVRSSSGAEKARLFDTLRTLAQANGADYGQHGEYPAWEYRKDSPLRDVMVRVFEKQYGRAPVIETIHAGLECGLLSEKMPGLDAVSIGPDLVDIHSARERMSISSVQRTWAFLLEVLAQL